MQALRNSLPLFTAAVSLACMGMASHGNAWQSRESQSSVPESAIGDVVDNLGDNLMLIHQDNSKRWWFGTWGDGLYRYDGNITVHFTTKHGLSHDRVDQILEDPTGNLYFATPSGVSRFDGKQFTTLPQSSSSEWKLMPGDLWFKNSRYADHVYRYDGQTLHSLQMPKVKVGEDFIANHRGTPSPYGVYTIYRDKLDHVWFGTAAVGVCRFDGKSFQWLTSDDVNELHDGPSNGVRSIIEDHNGHFWFNTRYRYAINQSPFALSPVTPSEGIFQRHPGMGSLDGKPDGEYEYMSIAKDRNNLLWIATYQGGVYCYDGTQLKHYPIMDGSKIVMLFTVYVDHEGTVWLGTHSCGAYRFNGASFERFFPRQE